MKRIAFFTALCVVLTAWRPGPGGDSFELHVENKLMVRYFYTSKEPVPKVRLRRDAAPVQLAFNHCGRTDTQRQITARDGSGKVVKVWSFPDAQTDTGNRMTLAWEGVQKHATIRLYYAAREFPKEAVLLDITFTGEP